MLLRSVYEFLPIRQRSLVGKFLHFMNRFKLQQPQPFFKGLARARRRTGQPDTKYRRGIVLPLRESRQQVGGTAGFLGSGHADSIRDLDMPDRSASGTLSGTLEVPKRVGIKEILSLALGAYEQHSFSPSDALLVFQPFDILRRQSSQFTEDILVVGAYRLQ